MKTYPYQDGDQLIELVEKREYEGMELPAHELAILRAEDMATINDPRKELIRLREAIELLREIRDNEVNPQDETDKFLRDHQPSELSKARQELDEMKSLLESEKSTRNAIIKKGVEMEQAAKQEIQDAVKRMEEVPVEELTKTFWGPGQATVSSWGCDRVRARLIQAAKGECQTCKGLGGITRRVDAPHVGAYHVACPDCQPLAKGES